MNTRFTTMTRVWLTVALLAGWPAVASAADGSIVAWGSNGWGQCNVPPPNTDFVAAAVGFGHSLGLKTDGSIEAWGLNKYGQCNVPTPNTGFVAVAGGWVHSLGLKTDGSIEAWGFNYHGQCDVPVPNTDFVAVAGGGYHTLGLKADGSIEAWGLNKYGQCNVPAPNTDFVAVAGGAMHSLGLKADGSIVAWGACGEGQCNVPAPNTGFVAVAGGGYHSLGLKADGSIEAWGWNKYGQCDVPAPNTDFVAVEAGLEHSLALKADGVIEAWGFNYYGQCDVPAPNTDFVAVAGGGEHSLGLKGDCTDTDDDGVPDCADDCPNSEGPFDEEVNLFPQCSGSNPVLNEPNEVGCTPFDLAVGCFEVCACQSQSEGQFQNCVVQACSDLIIDLGFCNDQGCVTRCFGMLESADFQENCCEVDDDCDDGNACTIDECFDQHCEGRCLDTDGSGLTGVVVEIDAPGNVLGPLAGATVAVTGGGEQTTPGDGQFSFSGLEPGPVTVTVSKADYYPVTRELELVSGETRHETFQLLAHSGGDTPGAFDFYSPNGDHLIEGMPGDISFEIIVVWNGSPGSVYYTVAGSQEPAEVSDLGGGLAWATLTLPAPSVVDACNEVTIEVVNGEGQTTWINTGVYVSPVPGIVVPWYQDNIPWTPDSLLLEFSYEDSHSWDLPLGGEDLQLGASLGLDAYLSYDLLAATFSGSLEAIGGFDFDWDVPGAEIEILGEGQLDLFGSLAISFAGCGPPEITPYWEASFDGRAGVGAPVVLIVDVIFPPLAPAVHYLLTIPIIKDVISALKVRVYLLGGASITGEYDPGDEDCFLGAYPLTVTGTLGIEAQALLELYGAEVGVYAGGDGTPEFEVCPDWAFQCLTLHAYVGVFAKAWLFEYSTELGAEIIFGECGLLGMMGEVSLDDPSTIGQWRPIGSTLLRWGDANRLAHAVPVRLPGADSAGVSGMALEEVLVENVTQLGSPSVIADPAETHINYVLHDPDKPWHQATDIASVRSVEGAPWTMERIADDSVADFDPRITPAETDLDLTAWEQVDGDISGAKDPGDVAPYLEIAVSWFDRTTEEWTAPVLLEDNDVVDRAPQPAVFGETTGVVWVQNEGGASPGHATSGDRLMFAEWDGVSWTAPQTLWTGQKGILSLSFAADGAGEGHVVFAVDEDGDLETENDRELYGVKTIDGSWQGAALLTGDAIEDALPVLVVPDAEVVCVWASGSTVMYTGLGAWDPAPVYEEYTLANEAPSLDGVTMPGGAAVAYTVQTPEGVDIVAAFYDGEQWTLPRQLTQDEHAELALSLAYDGTQLVIAYLKTQTERNEVDIEIEGEVYHLEDVPQPGRTDLYVLRHTLGHDLAVKADSVVLAPSNPEPGTQATIRATVENRGDLVAENVECAFYDGDPDSGGTLIGEVQIVPGELIAGASFEVITTWEVPDFPISHEVFVVVDPDVNFEDRDRDNNSTSLSAILPDIVLETGWSDPISSTSVALTARVTNPGVIPTGSFELSWRLGAVDGPEIGWSSVVSIVAGGASEIAVVWDTTGMPSGEWHQVHAIADLVQAITEADETNNVHTQAVIIPLLPCPADFNGDGVVGPFDLATLLGNWGPNPGHPADFDGDGEVGAFDLATLLGDWGSCE